MGQKVVLICDLHKDVREAVTTQAFSVGTKQYEVELCAEHLSQFNGALKPFISDARTSGTEQAAPRKPAGPGGRRSSPQASPVIDTAAMRAWASSMGLTVSDRGRIPFAVVEAYQAAQRTTSGESSTNGAAPTTTTTTTRTRPASRARSAAKARTPKARKTNASSTAKRRSRKKAATTETSE